MADLTKAQLEAKLKEYKADLAEALDTIGQLKEVVTTLKDKVNTNTNTNNTVVETTKNYSDDVTVVWMVDWPGYAKGNNFECFFNVIGQEQTLNKYAFDELAGKYHSWFEDGTIAVSYVNADVAARKKLRTDKDSKASPEIVNALGSMSVDEITDVWNSLKTKDEKLSIVAAYKRGFIEERDGYRDIAKVSALNALSGGVFTREITELSQGSVKYNPIDFNN